MLTARRYRSQALIQGARRSCGKALRWSSRALWRSFRAPWRSFRAQRGICFSLQPATKQILRRLRLLRMTGGGRWQPRHGLGGVGFLRRLRSVIKNTGNYQIFYETNPIAIENTRVTKKRTQSKPILQKTNWIRGTIKMHVAENKEKLKYAINTGIKGSIAQLFPPSSGLAYGRFKTQDLAPQTGILDPTLAKAAGAKTQSRGTYSPSPPRRRGSSLDSRLRGNDGSCCFHAFTARLKPGPDTRLKPCPGKAAASRRTPLFATKHSIMPA